MRGDLYHLFLRKDCKPKFDEKPYVGCFLFFLWSNHNLQIKAA